MIRHLVTWNFDEGTSPDQRTRVLNEIRALPEHDPALQPVLVGENFSTRDDTYAWAFTMDFDDEDALNDFLASEHHHWFVAEVWRPVISDRAITTFRC